MNVMNVSYTREYAQCLLVQYTLYVQFNLAELLSIYPAAQPVDVAA